ncbi:hypothetical protein [Pseudoxanthomonas sp. GM95]|uniref:hypothetical protein n=1 Tax=Pseudoxanthomonas sp. GM95 TaxID=1881043 RepID=UPI0020C86550|nr:hypothetical protein [Pseudoxanthomonas sp. GM95]
MIDRRVCAVLLVMCGPAAAQQAPPPSPAQETPPPLVTTLEEVRALPPDEETLDLYTFDNPIKVESNRFNDRYHPPPSPKEITENGGYLVYGFAKLVGFAAQGLQKIPGIKGQVQPAIARPPPLDLAQMERAARISAQGARDETSAMEAPAAPTPSHD